ncbi:MAG: hypothetical protein HFE90_07305 [Firmicutes bacterium]|nr:hypothetical protein [Bacillota bacterium]
MSGILYSLIPIATAKVGIPTPLACEIGETSGLTKRSRGYSRDLVHGILSWLIFENSFYIRFGYVRRNG